MNITIPRWEHQRCKGCYRVQEKGHLVGTETRVGLPLVAASTKAGVEITDEIDHLIEMLLRAEETSPWLLLLSFSPSKYLPDISMATSQLETEQEVVCRNQPCVTQCRAEEGQRIDKRRKRHMTNTTSFVILVSLKIKSQYV